jgi:hypothetical protein
VWSTRRYVRQPPSASRSRRPRTMTGTGSALLSTTPRHGLRRQRHTAPVAANSRLFDRSPARTLENQPLDDFTTVAVHAASQVLLRCSNNAWHFDYPGQVPTAETRVPPRKRRILQATIVIPIPGGTTWRSCQRGSPMETEHASTQLQVRGMAGCNMQYVRHCSRVSMARRRV